MRTKGSRAGILIILLFTSVSLFANILLLMRQSSRQQTWGFLCFLFLLLLHRFVSCLMLLILRRLHHRAIALNCRPFARRFNRRNLSSPLRLRRNRSTRSRFALMANCGWSRSNAQALGANCGTSGSLAFKLPSAIGLLRRECSLPYSQQILELTDCRLPLLSFRSKPLPIARHHYDLASTMQRRAESRDC